MPELKLNERAQAMVRQLVADRESLGIEVTNLPEGSLLVDAGINCPGSLEAGRLLAEICLGGLGRVELVQLFFTDFWLPGVQVTVQQPALACIASQYAGWALKGEGFFALGSGPARALAAKEEVFQALGYQENSPVGVLVLETRKVPPAAVVEKVVAACGLGPEDLSFWWPHRLPGRFRPGGSPGGGNGPSQADGAGLRSRQDNGGLWHLPPGPLAAEDLAAMGRTNDGVLYGGRCFYTVTDPEEEIVEIPAQGASLASRDYRTPFLKLLEQYGDFIRSIPSSSSPAEVVINNRPPGRSTGPDGWLGPPQASPCWEWQRIEDRDNKRGARAGMCRNWPGPSGSGGGGGNLPHYRPDGPGRPRRLYCRNQTLDDCHASWCGPSPGAPWNRSFSGWMPSTAWKRGSISSTPRWWKGPSTNTTPPPSWPRRACPPAHSGDGKLFRPWPPLPNWGRCGGQAPLWRSLGRGWCG